MNEVFIAVQTKVFLLSLLLGAVFCAVYDIFRVLRKTVVKRKTAVFFADILYWLFVTCGTLYITLIYCVGYVRGYVLAGIALGFVMFRAIFSRLLFRLVYQLLVLIKMVVSLLILPLLFVKRIVLAAAKRAAQAARRVTEHIKTKKIQKKQPQPSKKA